MITINISRYTKKRIAFTLFGLSIFFGVLSNLPNWILAESVEHRSKRVLTIYNQEGTFWHGGGLLVAHNLKDDSSSPLIMLHWHTTLGLVKFIDLKIDNGTSQIADIYWSKKGLNLRDLNISLSITQLSNLMDLLSDMGLSGNLKVTADQLILGSAREGIIHFNVENVSSGMSPVNPLGSYAIDFNIKTQQIDIKTVGSGILTLNGSGNLNSLHINATSSKEQEAKMSQVLTTVGTRKPDGSYDLKIF